MKPVISFTLILSLGIPLTFPLNPTFSSEITQEKETLIVQRRGGGNINRSNVGANGSGRVNRASNNRSGSQRTIQRENMNLHEQRANSGRVNKDQDRNRAQNVDRNNVNNRVNNVDRDNVRNRVDNSRDFNLDNDRNYSNRVNRNIVNTGNRNIVVNPRPGWGGWGWNGGSPWRPNYSYWGGGFWGGFAVGAVTTGITAAVVSAANNNDEPDYIIIEQNSPGYQLFDSYGLTQVRCIENGTLVFVYGPQESLICATPNNLVQAGYYDVDPEGLVLIAR